MRLALAAALMALLAGFAGACGGDDETSTRSDGTTASLDVDSLTTFSDDAAHMAADLSEDSILIDDGDLSRHAEQVATAARYLAEVPVIAYSDPHEWFGIAGRIGHLRMPLSTYIQTAANIAEKTSDRNEAIAAADAIERASEILNHATSSSVADLERSAIEEYFYLKVSVYEEQDAERYFEAEHAVIRTANELLIAVADFDRARAAVGVARFDSISVQEQARALLLQAEANFEQAQEASLEAIKVRNDHSQRFDWEFE